MYMSIPAGWTIQRKNEPPFQRISISKEIDGVRYVAIVDSTARNPENILYMLAEDLLNQETIDFSDIRPVGPRLGTITVDKRPTIEDYARSRMITGLSDGIHPGRHTYVRRPYSYGLTEADLWKVQLELWPGSEELSAAAMIKMADSLTESLEFPFLRTLVLALQYPVHIFYRTKEGHIGCRYGVDGPDYISGFTVG